MSKQIINNKGAGETGLTARTKINANFTELYDDISTIESDISALDAALADKLDANSPITGASKTKVTYDANGLITSGTDATTADIADTTDKRYCTDAQKIVIGNTSGTNTGDETITTIKSKLGITTLSGNNTGDEDITSIKSKLGITTLSGSNTGDQDLTHLVTGPSSVNDGAVPIFDSTTGKLIKESPHGSYGNNFGANTLTPVSTLETAGSFGVAVVSSGASSFNLDDTSTVLVCTGVTVDVYLPKLVDSIGRMYIIKGTDTTNTIRINADGGDEVDGTSSISITVAYGSITLVNATTSWIVINKYL